SHFIKSPNIKNFKDQDYSLLKEDCKSKEKLFEDREFQVDPQLLTDKTRDNESGKIQWHRPHAICTQQGINEGPKMFGVECHRSDIKQGEIGNCWFVAALTSLVQSKDVIQELIPSDQDFQTDHYHGIFRFRFWAFDERHEVLVDDRLPTVNGQLIYLKSETKNNLDNGSMLEAAVDLCGGIPRRIPLQNLENLFHIIHNDMLQGAVLGWGLNIEKTTQGEEKGLKGNHVYPIITARAIKPLNSEVVQLIYMKDPHGDGQQWTGNWGNEDEKWWKTDRDTRNSFESEWKRNGHFHMPVEECVNYFDKLEICYLDPSDMEEEDSSRKLRLTQSFGKWINMKDGDPFTIDSASSMTDLHSCIVSLRQMNMGEKAFFGFKVNDHSKTEVYTSGKLLNYREQSDRLRLTVGKYHLKPRRRNTNNLDDTEGEYFLRVFVEV
ncbi:hypothetical protein TCAL_12000, partial [Tigriopus californicus]